MATILLYISAVLGFLFGAYASLIGLALLVGSAAGGFGIANERRWGYRLALAAVGIELAFLAYLLTVDFGLLFDFAFLLNALWPTVLMALLLHPQSREYQRIWFK